MTKDTNLFLAKSNNLNNKFGRSRFKEFYIKRGSKGEVYGNEVSLEQYLTYTTEKPEKIAIEYYADHSDNYDEALQLFVKDFSILDDKMENMVGLVNLYKQPLDREVIDYYKNLKVQYNGQNILKIIDQELIDWQINLRELVESKKFEYEKV